MSVQSADDGCTGLEKFGKILYRKFIISQR